MVSKYYKISHEIAHLSIFSLNFYLYLFTYLINKLRRLKIYHLKGEMSSPAPMEII